MKCLIITSQNKAFGDILDCIPPVALDDVINLILTVEIEGMSIDKGMSGDKGCQVINSF